MAKKKINTSGDSSGITPIGGSYKNEYNSASYNPSKDSPSFYEEGSQYDKQIVQGADQNRVRANEQGLADELGNQSKKLLPNIALSMVETVGNLTDLENQLSLISNYETDFNNALSNWSKEQKQALNESNPLYKKSNESLDFGDSASIVENLGSIVESAAAFGITGLGLGFATSALGKTLAGTKYLKGLGQFTTNSSQFNSALALTHAEGVMTAADVYKQTTDYAKENLLIDNFTGEIIDRKDIVKYSPLQYRDLKEEEIDALGSRSGETALVTNYINTAFNYTSLTPFLNPLKRSREIIKNELKQSIGESTEQFLKRLNTLDYKKLTKYDGLKTIGAETVQEGLEEGVNVYAQNKGLAEGKSISNDDATLYNSLFSKEGLTAMGLGAIGGGANTFLAKSIGKLMGNSNTKREEKIFNEQKQQIADNYNESGLNFVKNINRIRDLQTDLNLLKVAEPETEEKRKENEILIKEKENELLSLNFYRNFNLGTTTSLESHLNELSQKSDEDLVNEGFKTKEDVKTFRDNVTKIKETLNNYEKIYNNIEETYSHLPSNYKQNLFLEKTNKDFYTKQKIDLDTKALQKSIELEDFINTNYGINKKSLGEMLPEDFEIDKTKTKYFKDSYTPESQKNISKLTPFKELKDLEEQRKENNIILKKTNDEINKLESSEFINKTVKDNKNQEEIKQNNQLSQEQKVEDNNKVNETVSKEPELKVQKQNLENQIADITKEDIEKGEVVLDDLSDIPIKEVLNQQYQVVIDDLQDIQDVKDLNKPEQPVVQNQAFNEDSEKDVAKEVRSTQQGLPDEKGITEKNGVKGSPFDNKLLSANTIALPSFIDFYVDKGKRKSLGIFNPEERKNLSVLSLQDYIGKNTKLLVEIENDKQYRSADPITGEIIVKDVPLFDDGEFTEFKITRILDNGQPEEVGYLHNMDYVNEHRIMDFDLTDKQGNVITVKDEKGIEHVVNNLDVQRSRLLQLRKDIFKQIKESGKPTEIIVTGKTWGNLFVIPENISLSDAVANDKNVKFVVLKNDGVYTSNSKKFKQENKELVNNFSESFLATNSGRVMVTLPTLSKVDDKEQHMAVYIKPTKLNELEDLKKDLVNVLSAYLNKDNETLQKYDLSDNPKVVQDYLDNFIYRNETSKSNENYLSLGYDKNNNPTLWVYDQLNKTNGSFINSGNLDKNIIKIDKWLDNQFFNIHINNMNDENKTVRLTKNNVIEEVKYTDFLKDTVKVNFRGNEITNNFGFKERVYFINPVLQIEINKKKTDSYPYRDEIANTPNKLKKETPSNKPVRKYSFAAVQEEEAFQAKTKATIPDSMFLSLDKGELNTPGLIRDNITKQVIDAYKQRDILKHFVHEFYNKYKEGSTSVNNNFKYIKDLFENNKELIEYFTDKNNISELTQEDKDSGIREDVEYNKRLLKEYDFIIDNFEQFKEKTIIELENLGFKFSNNKLAEGIIEEKDLSEIEQKEDDEDYTLDSEKDNLIRNENFEDGSASLLNPTDKLSAKMKVLLSFIPSSKTNYLGLPQFEDYDTMHTDLMKVLQLANPSLDSMINLMTSLQKEKPYLERVINLLNNNSEQIKNEFQSHFNLDYDERIVIQNEDSEKGYTTRIYNSNRNNYNNIILDKWKNNTDIQKDNISMYVFDVESGKTTINPEYIENVIKLEWEKVSETKTPQDLKDFLSLLGIDVSLITLEKTQEGLNKENVFVQGIVNGNSWDAQFKPKGLFYGIYNSFLGFKKDEDINDTNPFKNEQYIKKLSKLESIYTDDLTTSSSRDIEGKTRYDYRLPTRVKLRYKDIVKNNDNIRQSLLDTYIGFKSYILRGLESDTYGDLFKNNFNIGTMEGEVTSKTPFKKMFLREQERIKLDLFCNSGTKVDKGNFAATKVLTLSKSDKSTNYVMSFLRPTNLFSSNDNYLNDKALKVIRDIVLSEYNRYYKSQGKDLNKTYKNYQPENFYYFPFLNKETTPELYLANGELRAYNDTDIKDIIDVKIKKHFEQVINEQIALWNDFGFIQNGDIKIDENYKKEFLSNKDNRIQTLATEYVVTQYIANFEYSVLFSGDIATAYKKGKNGKSNVEATLDEYFKRLAKDIAPFQIEADANNEYYKVATIKEVEVSAKEEILENYSKYLSKEDLDKYKKITVADAQEYVTLEEYLNNLFYNGKLDDELYNDLISKVKKPNYNLSRKDLKLVLQVLKPVQVGQVFEEGFERIMYIKSSVFPLIPQLTKGTKLDNLRKIMEKSGVQRVALESAVKQGTKNSISWDKFNDENFIIPDKSITSLPRKYMGIQQETPHDANKEEILEGSQLQRLIFEALDLLGNNELYDKFNALHIELMNNAFQEFKTEIGFNFETNSLEDLTLLHNRLIKFALENNWTENEVQSLEITEDKKSFKIPIYLSNQPEKIESLITSMVTNDVIKTKLGGFSGILGSQLGLFENLNDKDKNGIVGVNGWSLKDGLKPMRVEDGVVKPGQVLVSRTRFKELFGTDNINDINPELLKLVGYRIPTQGYNSMTNLEVVGFLDNMGDLVILPNELIVQMGHDFDVDKMYFHKLKNDDSLEDEIVKVYMEVLSNKKIFDKIIKPVDTGELADVAKDLDKIQSKNNIRTVLTPYQQTLNYFKGTLAKDGVGKTSLLSTLNALFRGKDIGLNELTLDGYIPTGIDLSNPINENGRRKAEVILEMQSATVDHIKELVADKINYNNFTHDAFSGMVMIGKDWDFIGYLLPQESIMMYVKELSLLSDNLDDNFTKDKELEALGKVVSQLRDNLDIKQDVAFEYQTPDAKDFREQLVTYYNNSEKNSNYWETQLNILNTFYKYQNIGKDLFKVQMGINTSVKGVGKNFLEINSKLDAIEDLPKIERFSNTTSLIAPETIQGKANEVLQETANIFKPLFVYNSILVNDVFKKIGELKGNKNISTRKKKEVFKFIRSFIFSKPNGLYENVDVESLKSNLLLNNTNNDSLAKRWKDYFQKNPNHFFANRLYTNVSKDPNKPSTIRFLNIGTGKRTDDYQITAELISMLENGTEIEKQLVHDTISYNFITGGNQDSGNIIKYIPIDYLNKTGFSKDIVTNFNSVQNSYSIIKQYLQHNPKDAFQLSQDKQSELKKSKDKSKILLQLVGDSPLKFVSYFDKKWNLFEKVKGEFIQISTLGSEKITEADFTKSNSTSVFPKNNTQEVNQQLQESLKEMSNVNEEKEGKKVKEHCLNS